MSKVLHLGSRGSPAESEPSEHRSSLQRLGKDSLVYGFAAGINRFLGFLLLPLYTRIFSPADYGVLDVIATVTALAGIVLTAGIETALSYYFFAHSEEEERRATVTAGAAYLAGINLVVAAIVWWFAADISSVVFKTGEYAKYLRVAILSLPFSSLVSLNLDVMRLQRRPWAYLSLSVPYFLVTLVLNLILVAVLRVGVMGVFITNVIASVLFAVIGTAANRRFYGRAVRLARLRQMIRYGLPLVVGGISMWTINFLDRFFLVRFATLEEVGYYSVGLRIASMVAFATMAFRTANAPFQFEMAARQEARRIYASTFMAFVFGGATLTVLVGLFARPVLQVMATQQYLAAYRVVALGGCAAVLYGLYQLVSLGLLVTERTGVVGVVIGLGAIVNVALLSLTVPAFGMMGAALSTVLTHLTVVSILYVTAQRAYHVPYRLAKSLKVVGCAMLVLGLDWFRPTAGFWGDTAAAAAFTGAFVLAIRLVGALEPAEWQLIQAIGVRLAAPLRRQGVTST